MQKPLIIRSKRLAGNFYVIQHQQRKTIGRCMKKTQLASDSSVIDITSLSEGLYFVMLNDESGLVMKKLMVTR